MVVEYRCILIYIIIFFGLSYVSFKFGQIYNQDSIINNNNIIKVKNENDLSKLTLILKKLIYNVTSEPEYNFILQAIKELDTKFEYHIFPALNNRSEKTLKDVCPEKWLGVIDHPLYNKGHVEIECNKKPFEDVITFLIEADGCKTAVRLLNGVRKNYNVTVILAVKSTTKCTELNSERLIQVNGFKESVAGWLNLLSKVNTDYVMVAHNLYHFDNQSDIRRLVRMVSYYQTDIASGGVRLENGYWDSGCYQMKMMLYSLKIEPGYDRSFSSCQLCDYNPGPFVAKHSLVNDYLSSLSSLHSSSQLIFFDFFLSRVEKQQFPFVTCPDVLFHVNPYDLGNINKSHWKEVIPKKFELNRLLLLSSISSNKVVEFSCTDLGMDCKEKYADVLLPLCCVNMDIYQYPFVQQVINGSFSFDSSYLTEECNRPNFHSCKNNFIPGGNMQFNDVHL